MLHHEEMCYDVDLERFFDLLEVQVLGFAFGVQESGCYPCPAQDWFWDPEESGEGICGGMDGGFVGKIEVDGV